MKWNNLNCREWFLKDDRGRIRGSLSWSDCCWACYIRPRPHRIRVFLGYRKTIITGMSLVEVKLKKATA